MAEAEIGKIPNKPKEELIYDKNYRHSLTASSYTGQTSLLSNVSGSPILTEYYRQFLGASEEPITLQPDSIETYQSYTRIKGLILKIDGDKSPNFDDELGIITEQGVAFVMFDLAPIIGDVFIADIGDGLTGLYTISAPPRIRNITMDKVYEIDFRLIAIMNQAIEDNLNKKVVEEFVYSKDSAIRGGNAVITASDWEDNKKLNHLETLISKFIYENFFYNPEKTIILPGEDDVLYDPYLARFLQYTIPTRRLGMRDSISVVGTEFGSMRKGGKKINIWDMFLENDFDHPELYKQDYFIHLSESLINTKYYGGVYYSKIDRVILTEEEGASSEAYRFVGGTFIGEPYGSAERFPNKVGVKHDYFFSDEFYTGKPTKPNEKFIYDFFKNKTIDKKALLSILDDYFTKDPLEQLYMGGIYILAIRISLSSTYNYL